ncbi:hypothetical protein [Paenibacillus sp. SER-28]
MLESGIKSTKNILKIGKKIKETWPKELASMDMELDVKVNIKRPGLFQKSFKELLESENDN